MSSVENWNVQMVSTWLKRVGLSDYADLFAKHGINGEILLTMREQDLSSPPLNVSMFGHLRKFGIEIEKLKNSQNPLEQNDTSGQTTPNDTQFPSIGETTTHAEKPPLCGEAKESTENPTGTQEDTSAQTAENNPNGNQVPPTQDDVPGNNEEDEKLNEEFGRSIGNATKDIGRINLFVAGQTGVGKSTLVKAMFPEQLGNQVKSGKGSPVTKHIYEYKINDLPLSIFDSPGFELNNMNIQKNVTDFIKSRNDNVDPSQHIHLAWYCINVGSNRIQDAEKEFVNGLSELMPVTIVLTQCYMPDEEFCQLVKRAFPNVKNVVEVVAEKKYNKNTKQTIPAMGMETLCEASINLLPDAQAKAFAAAQKVDLKWKRIKGHSTVATAAAAAAVAGASPIPISDVFVIAPIQATMVCTLSAIFGLFLSAQNVKTILGVVTGGSFAGRFLVASILKLIPGVGSVVGGVINASTAAAVTTAFGEAYLATLAELWEQKHGDQIEFDTLLSKFKAKYTEKAKQK